MYSKTKVTLSPVEIDRLARHAFGDVAVQSVRELADGYFNTAYHLVFKGDHAQTVLKVGPPDDADILTYEKNLLRAEVDAMKRVASNPAVPVPVIAFEDFSRVHLPYDYYFMDFVTGTTWDKLRDSLTPTQNKRIEYRLGQITAQINTFENDRFGYFAYGYDFDNWAQTFRWMCELLFADARRYAIALELSEDEFFRHFETHRAIFAAVTRAQLVHWDLWAGNIFITFDEASGTDGTPDIAAVVDFERALWGDPLMESYPGRLTGIPDYMTGYGADILATQEQRLRRIFYNIYLDLVMVIEDGPRDYDDKSMVDWARDRLTRDIAMLRHGDVIA